MYLIGDPPRKASRPRCDKTIDARAQKIIDAAANTAISENDRAVQAFKSIMKTYYPTSVGKFSSVTYDSSQRGLGITYTGKGAKLTGEVTVGKDFLENLTSRFFARRVLQIGHEIVHVNQQRKGMGGGKMRARREFGAHCWAALTPAFKGTGCVTHSTRVAMIDCALRYYHCMTEVQQKASKAKLNPLLARRPLEEKASGNTFDPAPDSCSWDDIKSRC